MRPSGLKATPPTFWRGGAARRSRRPVAMSINRAVVSMRTGGQPGAIRAEGQPLDPILNRIGSPRGRRSAKSQSTTWLMTSAVPAASIRPSGLKARL